MIIMNSTGYQFELRRYKGLYNKRGPIFQLLQKSNKSALEHFNGKNFRTKDMANYLGLTNDIVHFDADVLIMMILINIKINSIH